MVAQNRQTARTREAIKTAFSELVFTSRYDEIKMVDVARAANVGRSTLYLHFPDKDAILLENMAPLLNDLATASQGEIAQTQIEAALHHIWLHRDRGRVVLFGSTGQKLERALASRVMEALPESADSLSLPFLANPLAAVVFSILRTWLRGEASGNIPDIAQHICSSSQALLHARR